MNDEALGRVLLARPTSLIVSHMKKLWTEASYLPVVLGHENELDSLDWSLINGVVISTSVLSPIKTDYPGMIKEVMRRCQGVPLFLASFSSIDKSKAVIGNSLESAEIDLKVLSLAEAAEKAVFSADKEVVIICKEEISDKDLFQSTLTRVGSILKNHRQQQKKQFSA